MEPEGSSPHSQAQATCPYPELAPSSPNTHIPLSEDPSNIILPSTPGSPQWSPSLRFPHQKPVHTSPLPPYALHDLPISFFLILSPAQYWVRSTDYSAPHYVIFSIPLLPGPS